MVQFKTSTLLLATVIASYAYGSVGAREHEVRELANELETRGLDLDDLITRVDIFEELIERGAFDSADDLSSREFEDIQARDGVVGFFKDVGKFVKRCANMYWSDMKARAGLLDFRNLVHGSEGAPEKRGIDGDVADLEARHHADWHKWRRRWEAGHEVASRSFDDDLELEARHHADWHKWSRRFENGHQVTKLEAREDTSELLPRMSWFGKALLIYRDIKNPLEKRSEPQFDGELMYRELLDDLEHFGRAYNDILEERGFDLDLDLLD